MKAGMKRRDAKKISASTGMKASATTRLRSVYHGPRAGRKPQKISMDTQRHVTDLVPKFLDPVRDFGSSQGSQVDGAS
jgi:hypothetical protein